MDVTKLRKALGLPDETPEAEVLNKATEKFIANSDAADKLASIGDELKKNGFALDQGKIVKLAADPPADEIPADETPREKALRERLDKMENDGAKARLSSAKTEAERFIKEGKVPPAMAAKLQTLLSLSSKAEALSLAQDGESVVRTAIDAVTLTREILNSVPTFHGTGLATLTPAGQEEAEKAKKESEALSTKAKGVAARVQGRKPEPANK